MAARSWPPTSTAGTGSRRSALAQPARLRHRRSVGAQDRPRGGDARGPAHPWLRRRDGRAHPGGALLRPGGAGVARHRIRHALPARAAGEALAARRGPTARLRREGDGPTHDRPGCARLPGSRPRRGPRGRDDHRWHVAVGDEVELNQTLCMVETNKAEVEIPSPYAGRIVELGGAEGETLAVGAVLVRIATDAPAPASQNGADTGAQARAGRLRHRRRDGHQRRVPVEDGTRPRAKPPVRKLAADLHVDLASWRRVGPGGHRHPRGCARRRGDVGRGLRTRSMYGVQATMAQRMALSRSKIPDAHARVQVDCTALLRLRDRLREAAATTDRRSRRSC